MDSYPKSTDPLSFVEYITTPYEKSPPAFCYPGMPIDKDLSALAEIVVRKQFNSIGTHTVEGAHEGGFGTIQSMEASLIWNLASIQFSADKSTIPSLIDGYMCGGGTEANIMGIWIIFKFLQELFPVIPSTTSYMRDITEDRIAIVTSTATHYSVRKACNILGIKAFVEINTNDHFEIDEIDLRNKLNMIHHDGIQAIILVGTVGTTAFGSIDDIAMIERIANESPFKHHYGIHVDASFGGFTVPFVADSPKYGFDNEHVMTMALDADKMGMLPYPSGIFMCRKHLQRKIEMYVKYINGHVDDTLSGSRSAMAAIIGWKYWLLPSFDHAVLKHAEFVRTAISKRDHLRDMINVAKCDGFKTLSASSFVNILPVIIKRKVGDSWVELELADIHNPQIANYELRNDEVIINGILTKVYKICVMTHTFDYIEQFVQNILKYINNDTSAMTAAVDEPTGDIAAPQWATKAIAAAREEVIAVDEPTGDIAAPQWATKAIVAAREEAIAVDEPTGDMTALYWTSEALAEALAADDESGDISISKKSPVGDMVVTPWAVTGRVDYMRLVEEYGTEIIDNSLLDEFIEAVGDVHPWITRKLVFSHRELHLFLKNFADGKPCYLYTGRGPSSDSLHFGHLIPFIFTKWLQDKFHIPLVIQMSDDEKYCCKDFSFEEIKRFEYENAKDIIACGFNPNLTLIFSNRDYRIQTPEYEVLVSDLKRNYRFREVRGIFGFGDDTNIGMVDWPFYQTAPSFSLAFPDIFGHEMATCLIPYAIDQDNYFRMGRDLANDLGLVKSASIITQFLPALSGDSGKMSSTAGSVTSIFLTDTPDQIRDKVMTHAFSGGGGNGSLADHRLYGGNIEKDTACQYLMFLEMDQERLDHMLTEFKAGRMTCGETKQLLVDKLTEMALNHQYQRSLVTDETVKQFYDIRKFHRDRIEPNIESANIIEYLMQHMASNISYQIVPHDAIINIAMAKELRETIHGELCKVVLFKDVEDKDLLVMYITNMTATPSIAKIGRVVGHKLTKCEPDVIGSSEPILSPFNHIMNPFPDDMEIVVDKHVLKYYYLNFHANCPDVLIAISPGQFRNYCRIIGHKMIVFDT